jgi:hypothetical protein
MPKWLILLSAYLLVWVPLNFAVLASGSLSSLDSRGWPAVAELAAHGAAAMLCGVAGWMLRVGNAAGRRLAAAALVANAGTTIQALYSSALPRDVQPGLALPLMILTAGHALAWLLYLGRSRRLRVWLGLPD